MSLLPYRLNSLQHGVAPANVSTSDFPMVMMLMGPSIAGGGGGGSHPSLPHMALLVFEAVMEVVCVSLPGYILARTGLFNQENQKFVANLNVSLFTPCLIFTKLASQLTLSKIAELAVIPVIFAFMTFVSYFCSLALAKMFQLDKRARNFVIAMGVFGNSNSLPISLVMSLSNTVSGLHWDRIPGDNDAEVAARGILYLLIFQQLGQLVRWSWGYHVLLAPAKDESAEPDVEAPPQDPFMSPQFENSLEGFFPHHPTTEPTENEPLLGQRNHHRHYTGSTNDSAFESGPSGERTPVSNGKPTRPSTPPSPPQQRLAYRICSSFLNGVWEFMNPPLWAMLVALIVASVPRLQYIFFTPGTFVNNSVTRAVSQSGGVAVPLILVVLGANLANSTSGTATPHETKHENKLLFASLVSRMVLPVIFCTPALALAAKYVSISILDDPIFVVVCFLLVGAPSALQLAQICQINEVYESAITRVLFWGYVVVVLPSTLILVVAALEVVEWAM